MLETINLTPNYANMFTQFLPEMRTYTQRLIDTADEIAQEPKILNRVEKEAARRARQESLLSDLNGLLSATNMAAQCMTTVEEITRFRTATHDVLERVNERLREIQALGA